MADREMILSPTARKLVNNALDRRGDKTRKALQAYIARLEADVLCGECGHYRSDHDEGDSPCFGGREGLKTGEGEYCMCSGFAAAPLTEKPNE